MFLHYRNAMIVPVMENTYVISWKSKSEPRSGQGKKMFSREDAEALAHQLNCDYPLFFHQAFNVATAAPMPEPAVILPLDFQSRAADELELTFIAAATEIPEPVAALG